MIATDEDSLICDFAEVYHIFNYRELSLDMAATLCCGLGENSRTMRSKSSLSVSVETLLLANIVDALNILIWQNTKNGQKGINHPESVARRLIGAEDEKQNEVYSSGEEFLEARKRIIEEIERGEALSQQN